MRFVSCPSGSVAQIDVLLVGSVDLVLVLAVSDESDQEKPPHSSGRPPQPLNLAKRQIAPPLSGSFPPARVMYPYCTFPLLIHIFYIEIPAAPSPSGPVPKPCEAKRKGHPPEQDIKSTHLMPWMIRPNNSTHGYTTAKAPLTLSLVRSGR